MDLRTSRKPPAIPRAIASGDTEHDRQVLALLSEPMLPLELVRALTLPRLEVWSTVRRLSLSLCLATTRAAFAREGGSAPTRWGCLPLGQLGDRVVDTLIRGLAGLGAQASIAAVLEALAVPVEAEFTPTWRGFLENERFSTRVAFGLPDEPEAGAADRFSQALGEILGGLGSRSPALARRLEDLIDGRPCPPVQVQSIAARLDSRGDLREALAQCVVATLGEANEVESWVAALGQARILTTFVGDHRAVTGRGGPRPTPAWLVEPVFLIPVAEQGASEPA